LHVQLIAYQLAGSENTRKAGRARLSAGTPASAVMTGGASGRASTLEAEVASVSRWGDSRLARSCQTYSVGRNAYQRVP